MRHANAKSKILGGQISVPADAARGIYYLCPRGPACIHGWHLCASSRWDFRAILVAQNGGSFGSAVETNGSKAESASLLLDDCFRLGMLDSAANNFFDQSCPVLTAAPLPAS